MFSLFVLLQVQIDNDKIRDRGSHIDLSNLRISSTTAQSAATIRQHPEQQQRTTSTRVTRNGLIIDSQGNNIPLSPVSSNTSSSTSSDNMESHKVTPMTTSGEFIIILQIFSFLMREKFPLNN